MCTQNVFECLRTKANEAVANNPGIEQVLAIRTAAGRTYLILNDQVTAGNYEAEQHFVTMLSKSEDTHVLYVVALWRDCEPDLPSFHFRSQLVLLNPNNMDTLILMRDMNGYHGRALGSTL